MIEIKITADTAPEALDQLAAMAAQCSAAALTKSTKGAPKPKSVPVEEPEAPAEPETSAEPETATYTLEQVRAKGLEAAKQHGQPAVKAILEELGVANMGSLKAAQFAAFVDALEGLGDSNA